MKTLCLTLLLILLLATGAYSQNITAQGTTCATTNACVSAQISQNQGGATITITGNSGGNTLQFEGTGDGINWVSLNTTSLSSTTPGTSTTTNDTFQVNAAGLKGIRVRCSTFVSGTVTVAINTSNASARVGGGGGGGGGSGTVSGQANGVIPLATAPTVIGAQSHMNDGVTTAGVISSTEPIAACVGCTTAGYLQLKQGTANTAAANTVLFQSPTSVTTAYSITLAGAGPSSACLPHYSALSSANTNQTCSAVTTTDAGTNVQGNGSKFLLSSTVTGTGATLCTDASGNATTSGCTGGGGVTSVGQTMPSGFTVSGSPITTSGTLAVTYPASTTNPSSDFNSPYVEVYEGRAYCSVNVGNANMPVTNNGCVLAVGSMAGAAGASSTTPSLEAFTAPTTGTGNGILSIIGSTSTAKWDFVSGRPLGLWSHTSQINSATTSIRLAAGFTKQGATTVANFYAAATTANCPVCWDTAPSGSPASVFVGVSSTSGSYGGGAGTLHFVLVGNDGSCGATTNCTYTDLGVAFTASTLWAIRVWEDVTGNSCSVANTVPCWCGAVASLGGSNSTLAWSSWTSACINGTSNKVPALGTQLNYFSGQEGNGGTTGTPDIGVTAVRASF